MKKPEVVSPNEKKVLENTLIDAKVEFKLTKEDLSDMVLDERQEHLEEQLSMVTKEVNEIEKQMQQLDESHVEHIKSLTKKELGKRIRSAEKFFGAAAKIEACGGDHCLGERKVYVSYDAYDKNYNSSRRRKSSKTDYINGWYVKSYVVANVGVSGTDKESALKGHGSWSISKLFTKEGLMEMPIVKKLVELDKKRLELLKTKILTNAELNNLETLGKRSKAKMVRALLSSSEQGKALLSKMPKMNQKLLSA